MTIQRQYTMPLCNLLVEGLSADPNDPQSPLAVLMNAECHLPGASDAPLTGGREFLDSLVAAVSRYGQQLLSRVMRPASTPGAPPPLVEVKPGEGGYHHLIVQVPSQGEPITDTNVQAPRDVKLTTVQFYDLMEAIDQLLADTQTLPDLTANFQAVSRRSVKPAEPISQRAAPAAIGAAALAAAGLALFFVPPPQFEPSKSSQESDAPAATETTPDGTDPLAVPGESPATSGDLSPEAATPSPTDNAAAVDRLAGAATIADPATVALLQSDLTRRLQQAWAADPPPSGDLTYRVVVSEDGDILGYKYNNDLALAEVDTTPLPTLTFQPVEGATAAQEPVAQFTTTFTPAGEVLVEPISTGESPVDAEAATAAELPTLTDKITDGDQIRTLNSTLYDSILSQLGPLSASEPLTFQVRLDAAGTLVGYAPVNAAAGLLASETPLPGLVSTPDGSLEQADFKVVFTETGVLEVSPWEGWPQE
ncbi:MAG: DUF4335 domain-containing protein [Nodosilinea sp.]